MDKKDYDNIPDRPAINDSDEYSGIYTDEETAHRELEGIFSNKFSNIHQLYSSSQGATEIHSAMRYGKRYILKGLRKEYREDPVNKMCMAKEFEIGITLEHPNIRRTIGLENVDGLGKRIVLEYIDGITLADELSSGHIISEKALSIARQIASALKYLHSKQICHRDLKPENILLTHQCNTVKIIDFNLSDKDDYLVLKNPAGSKRYMAPELSGPDPVPTPEADYYSLGVIIKDLAEASHNRMLAQAALRCTDRDPNKRNEGIQMLETGREPQKSDSWTNRILSSKSLTYILSGICLMLMVFITFHYL